jgi:hypothetical protein
MGYGRGFVGRASDSLETGSETLSEGFTKHFGSCSKERLGDGADS